VRDIEKLKMDIKMLESEWETLTSNDVIIILIKKTPLVKIQNEQDRLENEGDKLKDLISQLESEQQKLHDSILTIGADLDVLESDVSNLSKEKIELQATVDAQEISPADVDRMNSERDQLVKSLEITCCKLDEINKEIWDSEIQIQKKMDHVIIYLLILVGKTRSTVQH
jgi:kinetochore protein NDC80